MKGFSTQHVYLCECMCKRMCVHLCLLGWNPQESVLSSTVGVGIKLRSSACVPSVFTHWATPPVPPLCLLRQSLSLNLNTVALARLAGHRAPGTHLSPVPQHWGYRCTPPSLAFKWLLGIRTESLMPLRQVLYLLNHLPSLQISFLTFRLT